MHLCNFTDVFASVLRHCPSEEHGHYRLVCKLWLEAVNQLVEKIAPRGDSAHRLPGRLPNLKKLSLQHLRDPWPSDLDWLTSYGKLTAVKLPEWCMDPVPNVVEDILLNNKELSCLELGGGATKITIGLLPRLTALRTLDLLVYHEDTLHTLVAVLPELKLLSALTVSAQEVDAESDDGELHPVDWSPLSHLCHLTCLNIQGACWEGWLPKLHLSSLKALTHWIEWDEGVEKEIEAVGKLNQLEQLEIYFPIETVSIVDALQRFLPGLTKLKKLCFKSNFVPGGDLTCNDIILGTLLGLNTLQELSYEGENTDSHGVYTIQCGQRLSALTHLQHLDVDCFKLDDQGVIAVSQLPNLHSLLMGWNRSLPSSALSLLGRSSCIKRFTLSFRRDPAVRNGHVSWVQKMAFLFSLTGLSHLRLEGAHDCHCKVRASQMAPLTGLTQLRSLNLAGCHVADMGSFIEKTLAQMTWLQTLVMPMTKVPEVEDGDKVSCLSKLTRLSRLDLCGKWSEISSREGRDDWPGSVVLATVLKMTSLQYVSLGNLAWGKGMDGVRELAELAKLPFLRWLFCCRDDEERGRLREKVPLLKAVLMDNAWSFDVWDDV